jgi:hypothetical protein
MAEPQFIRDMKSRDFFIALTVTLVAFFITFHLPRVLDRNV